MPDAMSVASFTSLLQAFAPCFTAPSFDTFAMLMSGWVLSLGRHTVTGTVQAGPQNRTERAVERTAPMALLAYGFVVLWYVQSGQHLRAARMPTMPWYASKTTPAFSDMLATLRRASWLERLSLPCANVSTLRKVMRPIVAYAAAA